MSGDGLLVLVAEDSEDLREAYVDWFVYKGVRAEQASSGPETLLKALEFRPSVVVMDLSLPGLDGFEVARRLREQFPDRSMLLVALTGYGQERDRLRAREAGFDHHLLKPVRLELLEQLLVS